jgi:hypothetical protein
VSGFEHDRVVGPDGAAQLASVAAMRGRLTYHWIVGSFVLAGIACVVAAAGVVRIAPVTSRPGAPPDPVPVPVSHAVDVRPA